MRQKKLSITGLTVSALGLGCMGMSEFYGSTEEIESLATLDRAIELGVTHLDTADIYGYGANEILIAKLLKRHRNKVTLASKFGIMRDINDPSVRGVNGAPSYVKACCEASLKRLGIETIDLYYMHRMDPNVPIEDTIGALSDLIKEGKIRYIGLSEASTELIRRAHAVHPLSAIQTEYSLWSRVPEKEILPLCQELGIGFVAYSPLSRGLLSNNMQVSHLEPNDFRKNLPRFQNDNIQKNANLLAGLENFIKKKDCTLSQLAIAWVLAQGEHVTAIPGTKRRTYLEENYAAVDLVLSQDDLDTINTLVPMGSVSGLRYPVASMQQFKLDK